MSDDGWETVPADDGWETVAAPRTPEENARETAAVQSLTEHKFRNAIGGTAGFDPAKLKQWGKSLAAVPATGVNLLTGAIGGMAKIAVSPLLQIATRLDKDIPAGGANDATVQIGDDVAESFATHFGGEEGRALTNAVGQVVSLPLRGAKWVADQAATPSEQAISEAPSASMLENATRSVFGFLPDATRPAVGAGIDAGANIAATITPMESAAGSVKPAKVSLSNKVDVLSDAQQKGLRVASYVKKGGLADDTALGHAGVAKTQQLESVKNQPKVQEMVKEELGVPKHQDLNLQALKDLEAVPRANVESLKKLDPGSKPASPALGWVDTTSTKFQSALDKILARDKSAGRDFGKLEGTGAVDIESLVEQHRNPLGNDGFGIGSGINRIFQLRQQASEAFTSQKPNAALGKAYRDIANAMEDAIDEHLAVNGVQQDLIGTFRESRAQMAKIDAVRKRMNPATGHVDAVALGKDLAKNQQGKGGVPLTGKLKEIATIAQAAPKSFQLPEKVGPVTNFSAIDTAAAAMSGKVASVGALATRAPIRSFITSKYYNIHGGAATTIAKQVDKAMKRTAMKRGTLAGMTAGEISAMQNYVDEDRKSALENAQ